MPRGPKPQKPLHLRLIEKHDQRAFEHQPAAVRHAVPDEPDWRGWFPATRGAQAEESKRLRADAKAAWKLMTAELATRLNPVDLFVLSEAAVCTARIRSIERQIARDGIAIAGYRGSTVKHPLSATLNQYRSALRTYITELGLSPTARIRLPIQPPHEAVDDILD